MGSRFYFLVESCAREGDSEAEVDSARTAFLLNHALAQLDASVRLVADVE